MDTWGAMRIVNRRKILSAVVLAWDVFAGAPRYGASVIGMNPPALSITRDRIAQLPPAEREAWKVYLQRSEQKREADKNVIAAELKRAGLKIAIEPPHGSSAKSIPLDRAPSWYASPEATHIADVIVSFQTPAGGWGKNLDMSKELRRPGETYGPNNLSNFLAPGDFDTPADPSWNYIGTIDNDATTTQLNFLAKVISASGSLNAKQFRASFLLGIEYLLEAQFPNGGWPQVWPLEGGYHDAITYNDNAMTQVLDLLDRVSRGEGDFAFVPKDLRRQVAESFARGIRCLLETQIKNNGRLTAWAQQVDPFTLQPVSARNFEMPAISAGESAGILLLLMNDLPHPTAEEQRAIDSGIAWLRKTSIYGESWQHSPDGRDLMPAAGSGPLWARYYQIGTNKPIFGDRDKSIHDDVKEISRERRNGYAWYSDGAKQALDRFTTWSQQHPEPQ